MDKTENGIHELINDEEIAYYLSAFRKIENNEKTWNWPAFFLCSQWALYRKMYLYSFFCVFLTIASLFLPLIILDCLGLPKTSAWVYGSVGVSHFLFSCGLGYFANSIYYRIVKKRIKKGYHLMEKFKPTSITAIISGPIIGGIILTLADRLANKNHEDENNLPTDENIVKYLNPNRANHRAAKIANVVLLVIFALGLSAK